MVKYVRLIEAVCLKFLNRKREKLLHKTNEAVFLDLGCFDSIIYFIYFIHVLCMQTYMIMFIKSQYISSTKFKYFTVFFLKKK